MEFKELFLSEQVNFDHVVKTGISLKNNDSITEWVEWFRQKLLLDVTTDYDSLLVLSTRSTIYCKSRVCP
jgi:hypothetical protein